MLSADTPCPFCGYNLRGLRTDSTCPECGHSLREAILLKTGIFCNPRWLKTMNQGMWLTLAGSLLMIGRPIFEMANRLVIYFSPDHAMLIQVASTVFGALGCPGSILFAMGGYFLTTRLDPQDQHPAFRHFRIYLRMGFLLSIPLMLFKIWFFIFRQKNIYYAGTMSLYAGVHNTFRITELLPLLCCYLFLVFQHLQAHRFRKRMKWSVLISLIPGLFPYTIISHFYNTIRMINHTYNFEYLLPWPYWFYLDQTWGVGLLICLGILARTAKDFRETFQSPKASAHGTDLNRNGLAQMTCQT